MRASGGRRIEWHDVPPRVRGAVEGALGAHITSAVNQPGGFSPGVAARCELSDGRQTFVKAVSPDQNPHACRIHRREAEIARQLPSWFPAPALRHVVDDGEWVVLVFEEVAGHTPNEPWTWDDLDLVLPAIGDLARRATPSPVDAQSVVDRHRPVFDGWRRLAAGDGDVSGLGRWAVDHLHELAAREPRWEDAASGDTLLHADLRADNILLGDDGRVWFVDWPWACVGAAFVDVAFMLPSVGLGGGPPPAAVVERYGLFAGVGDEDLVAVVVALAGFFLRSSLDPPPPGIPAVRAFQRAQGDVAVAWLETMWG